ncbi:MAG: amino acid carrier protein [Bacteroidota bacterium]
MKKILFPLIALVVLAGCSGGADEKKKVDFTVQQNGKQVTLKADVDPSVGAVDYKWVMGKKLDTIQGPEANYTYAEGGYYDVELLAIDACGNLHTDKQEVAADPGLDRKIDRGFQPVTNFIESIVFVSFSFPGLEENVPIVLVILIFGALFFTIYFRFINFRRFRLAIDIVRGKYSDPNESGEVSHFQALTAALSGTVGLGNIAGVAIAVGAGGPGATFWMILAGLLGMSSKFVECTLGVKYREVDEDGRVYGGPMYYLRKGFTGMKMIVGGKETNFSGIGKTLAAIFAVAAIGGSFGGGNMFQVNQAFSQFAAMPFMEGTYVGENGWVFGAIMAVLVGIVIIGGIRSIAKVTDKIVPFMCGVYVLAALVVLGANFSAIPAAFGAIFEGAFTGEAVTGGVIGVLIQGFRRAAFSNEAGIGSASIAHSAVKTNNPASEGLVALLEPFIDTVVVCTMTALVIVITGKYTMASDDGIAITSAAFQETISWFPYLLVVAVILFAFSTMITWSYYGMQAWAYLFGRSKRMEYVYKAIFCIMVIIGAASSLGAVIGFSDAMIFSMLFPNIIGLIFLLPVVKNELNDYLGKIKSGEIKTVDLSKKHK